MKISTFVIF